MKEISVGKSINRIDNLDKVTGKAKYPGDYNLPNQAYMKTIFAERPHARIMSIDTSQAESFPGVLAVLTAKDVPNNEYGLISPDQPVLCGPGSGKAYAEHVRFVGDQIALIIAETEEIADYAADLVLINFEDLPVVSDFEQALEANAKKVHPDKESNLFCEYNIKFGDMEKGFEEADVIIESVYHTPVQEHAYLQPEAGVSYLDDEGRITVIVAGQWTHEDREQISHALAIPEEKVRVIYPAIGGAFGGREDMSIQITLALATVKLSEKGIFRPVKTVWSRRESIIGHHKRHQYRIKTRWGAKNDGKITAVEAEILADGGAYMYTSTKVIANATLMVTGPYFIPNVKVNSKAVYTNHIPGGAFRGFGGPQACFAAEMQMNKVAEALKIDPVELRLRNTIQEGQLTSVGSPLPKGISIDKAIIACAERAGWQKKEDGWKRTKKLEDNPSGELTRGIAFSCGYKNVGFSFGAPENCWAKVKLVGNTEVEKVIVYHAGAEVGQGAHTVFVQIAANEVGVPVSQVELVASDTAITGNSGSVSASRMTFMAGNAILGASREAMARWKEEERPAEGEFVYRPPATTPFDPIDGHCTPNFAYGYAAESVEVLVNKKTGKVTIEKVVCADDVGKAINPKQVIGQIEGAIVQAAGYTLIENFVQDNGKVKTDSLATYLIPTIMDIPGKIESVVLEETDPIGPLGARGVGEMPYLPFAPAVASAVHNAIGIWYDAFPLTEERILKGLGEI